MRDALITAGLVVAIYLSFAIQEFIPPLGIAEGARVYLAPVLFCCGACALPFASMVVLASVTGFLSDFTSLQVVQRAADATDVDALHFVSTSVEISAGWSILLFVAVGSICQGLRPLVLRGHWWLPSLMSAATTIAFLSLQFAMITMRRFDTGGFFWSQAVTWRVLAPGAFALFLGLVLMVLVNLVDHWFFTHRRPLREF